MVLLTGFLQGPRVLGPTRLSRRRPCCTFSRDPAWNPPRCGRWVGARCLIRSVLVLSNFHKADANFIFFHAPHASVSRKKKERIEVWRTHLLCSVLNPPCCL